MLVVDSCGSLVNAYDLFDFEAVHKSIAHSSTCYIRGTCQFALHQGKAFFILQRNTGELH